MADPTPLLNHIYQMWIEQQLGGMRARGRPYIAEAPLVEPLYCDFAGRLPGQPCHNPRVRPVTEKHFPAYESKPAVAGIRLSPERYFHVYQSLPEELKEEEKLHGLSKSIDTLALTAVPTLAELAALSK